MFKKLFANKNMLSEARVLPKRGGFFKKGLLLKKGVYIVLGLLIGAFISAVLVMDANGFKSVSPEKEIDQVKYNQRLVEAGKPSNKFMLEQLDKLDIMMKEANAKETYFVTEDKLNQYVNSQVVTYGRANPMFYTGVIAVIPDEVPAGEDTEGVESDEALTETGKLSGYDTTTGKMVAKNVDYITKAFKEDGMLPVMSKFFNVSSGFGLRTDPTNPDTKSFHVGLDIFGEKINGQEVYSVLNGTVSLIDTNDILGNFIVINHGGFNTAYAHLEGFARGLSEGQLISAGGVLGYVGSTGISTGPHLHFEVEENGVKFNPEYFLSAVNGYPSVSKHGYWQEGTNR